MRVQIQRRNFKQQGAEEEGERCKEEGGEGRYDKEGECEDMEPAKADGQEERGGGWNIMYRVFFVQKWSFNNCLLLETFCLLN